MNYHQTYDPMQASAMRQQQNSQLAGSIKGGLSGIQAGLQENAQWKKFQAESKTEAEAKARIWEAASDSLRESGLTEKEIPELANMPSYVANGKITFEQFNTKLGAILEPVKETIMAKKVINSANAQGTGENQMAKIKGIPSADAMVPPELAQAPSSFVGPPAPAGADTSFVGPQQPAMDPMIGATEAYIAPKQTPEQAREQEHVNARQLLFKGLVERQRAGLLKSGEVQKFEDNLARNEENASKERLADKKIRLAEIEAAAEKERNRKDSLGKQTVDASSTNEILSRATGKVTPFSSAEVAENPDNYLIGDRKYNPNSGGGGNSPSLDPVNLEPKLQKAIIDRLLASGKDKEFTIEGTDALGNPKYIPKPGTESWKVLNIPALYKNTAVEWFPHLSKKLGITATVPALGGGYNKQ